MKHALTAALLSLLVPGLGQLYNRRIGRGIALVLGMSFVLIGFSIALFYKVGQAAATLTEEQIATRDFSLLSRAFREQDLTVIIIILAVLAPVWVGAVIDAFRDGRKFEERREQTILDEAAGKDHV